MWPDRVSNPGPLTYESGALLIAYAGRILALGSHQINRRIGVEPAIFRLIVHHYTTTAAVKIVWETTYNFPMSLLFSPVVRPLSPVICSEFQIRGRKKDNLKIIFLISQQKRML